MRIPAVLKPYPIATLDEVQKVNKLERRIATLDKWIDERKTLRDELDAILKFVKARSGPQATKETRDE